MISIINHKENYMEKNSQYTCKDCFKQRSGDCFGQPKICGRFKYAPTISKETKKNWPTMGDASFIRQYGHRRDD